jgi:NAD(P)-dependent dehydrogenase (short-subunit alcohol dehydrogenase family)
MAPMPRTVLVTEGASPLGGALVRLLAARGCTVAVLRETGPAAKLEEQRGLLVVPWNRKSPVSARAALLAVSNAMEAIDEAVIVEPPGPSEAGLHEAASADIERAFDDAKGPAFLAREVLSLFLRRGAGVLCFASLGPAAGPLQGAAREGFRGLASALFSAPGGPGIVVNGFQAGAADPEEYAAFIDRTLEEKARKISGRWFVCPARGGFLQGVLAGQPRKG